MEDKIVKITKQIWGYIISASFGFSLALIIVNEKLKLALNMLVIMLAIILVSGLIVDGYISQKEKQHSLF